MTIAIAVMAVGLAVAVAVSVVLAGLDAAALEGAVNAHRHAVDRDEHTGRPRVGAEELIDHALGLEVEVARPRAGEDVERGARALGRSAERGESLLVDREV